MTASPILIAGPTASGKSALALGLSKRLGGPIVNADALQVYDGWRVLTARPSEADEAAAPHLLYGHVPMTEPYSVGAWLREVKTVLDQSETPPIIVGGTGLYFTALTEGLAEIPPTPPEIREEGDTIRLTGGASDLLKRLEIADPAILARIDQQNPARLQRAWEVWAATGTPLSTWQAQTGAPLVPLNSARSIVLDADRDWLNDRIARRFSMMLEGGALAEAEANAAMDRSLPSSRALGADALWSYLNGETTLAAAQEAAAISTRQYAKRQRTWFRSRMGNWQRIAVDASTKTAQLIDSALA